MPTDRKSLFCDTALAERIERAEVDLISAYSRAAHRREVRASDSSLEKELLDNLVGLQGSKSCPDDAKKPVIAGLVEGPDFGVCRTESGPMSPAPRNRAEPVH
jgi:hypothetical protein